MGIGSNALTARLALKLAKPNGIYTAPTEALSKWMLQFKVTDLPQGIFFKPTSSFMKFKLIIFFLVGRSTEKKLLTINVTDVATLQITPKEKLCKLLGAKIGTKLSEGAYGRDAREVKTGHQKPKSIGVDLTYGIRFSDNAQIVNFIGKIAAEVQKRLVTASMRGKKVITISFPG